MASAIFKTFNFALFIIWFSNVLVNTSWIPVSYHKLIYLPEIKDFQGLRINNIEDARSYCKNINSNLVSFDSEINFTYNESIKKANQWIWEDQTLVDPSLKITDESGGRCLYFSPANLSFSSVNCNNLTYYVPLCQKEIATNCQLFNGQYFGNVSESANKHPCLTWNSNILAKHGLLFKEQNLWNHNYCRNPSGYSKKNAWCMISEDTFEECKIKDCAQVSFQYDPVSFVENYSKCSNGSVSCNSSHQKASSQCIPEEFWCDYGKDCENGADEENCQNYIDSFTPIGSYKLLRQISSIWTNIFHLQSCAKKCIESETENCVLFSYDFANKLCVLSSQTNSTVLTANIAKIDGYQTYIKKSFIELLNIFNINDCQGIQCQRSGKCIERKNLCDGVNDCLDNEDEVSCFLPLNVTFQKYFTTQKYDEGILVGYLGSIKIGICSDNMPDVVLDKICPYKQQRPNVGLIQREPKFGTVCSDGLCYIDTFAGACKDERTEVIRCGDSCGRPNIALFSSHMRCKRIVGGCSIKPDESPWTASIRLRSPDSHHCGAAIISNLFLLTAAHCVSIVPKESLYIRVGDFNNLISEPQEINVGIAEVVLHPSYENIFNHDIAIIKLDTPLNFTQFVKPICLPPSTYQFEIGSECFVSGFGKFTNEDVENAPYSSLLQIAKVPILNKTFCRMANEGTVLGETTICAGYVAGGVDACHGDSGSPLACVYNGVFYLNAVVSWGDGCAEINKPGIYTSTSSYISWIENVTKSYF